MISFKYHLFVCTCQNCAKKGAENILLSFRKKIETEGLASEVNISRAGCVLKGECRKNGPFVVIYPQNVWYHNVTVDDVDVIIEQY